MKAGSQNVLIGQNCGGAMVSSHWNVAIGKDCADSATGLGNVIVGHDAGRSTSGNYNVVLGKAAGDVSSFSGANNIIIGYNADPTSASTSNEITLGNASINRFRVPGVKITVHNTAVGINTDDASRANLADPVGAGHSLVGLYIGDGSILFNNTLNRTGGYYISTETNALNAGPVTLDANMKVDGAWVIV